VDHGWSHEQLSLSFGNRRRFARVLTGAVVALLAFVVSLWLALAAPARFPRRLLGTVAFSALRLRGSLVLAPLARKHPVVLVGDSRMESLGGSLAGVRNAWAINIGLAGTTARFWRDALASRQLHHTDATFVLWVGINDLLVLGHRPATVAQDLEIVARRILGTWDARALIIVEQIPVRIEPESLNAEINRSVLALNRTFATLTTLSPRVVVLPLYARLCGADGRPLSTYYADGIHLNERGNRLLANSLRPTLK
jgi:lysophospholipase L1-like esterase